MKVQKININDYKSLDFGDKKFIKILWLDDIRNPKDYIKNLRDNVKINWVSRDDEFIEAIQDEGFKQYNIICMDHDLGPFSDDGSYCANALKDAALSCSDLGSLEYIFIHSSNPVGSERMYNTLKDLQHFTLVRQKTLKFKTFSYNDDLVDWVNKNINVTQIINISESGTSATRVHTLWYWEMENRPLRETNIHIQ